MWYCVVTVFIDGKFFDSRCAFKDGDTSPVGHCFAPLYEEPRNSCKKEFFGRIEIHSDWFESEDLAKRFQAGEITYKHIYDAWYKPSIKSTLTHFIKREIVEVNESQSILPYRGIYEQKVSEVKPYWVS